MRRQAQAFLLPVLLLSLPAANGFGQEVPKHVLDHIRSVSVSIEWQGKTHGSGTLFDNDGETWCLTANHVVEAAEGKPIRVSQHQAHGKVVSVNAEVAHQDRKTDIALLKIGKGIFGPGAKFYKECKPPQLDSPIVHCGSMAGLDHTVTRGYLVGLDRKLEAGQQTYDQADFTGYY